MIVIILNGKTHSLPSSHSLKNLLQELALENQSVAIAVNEEVIPRSKLEQIILRDQDRVEIVRPIGGG